MDMSKYKALFVSETQEHIQSMSQGLVTIEQNPHDQDAIAEAFRNAHSIKGMAASMGFEPIRDLAHAMEDLMELFRDGAKEVDSGAMDLLFQGIDILEKMVTEAAQDREIPDIGQDLSARLRQMAGQQGHGTALPDLGLGEPEEEVAEEVEDDELEDTGPVEEEELQEEEAEQEPPKPARSAADIELDFGDSLPRKTAPPKPASDSKPSVTGSDIELGFDDDMLLKRPGRKQAEETESQQPAPPPEPPATPDIPPPPPPVKLEPPPPPAREEEPAPPEIESPPPPAPAKPAASGEPSWTVKVVFSAQTAAPGVRGLILFKRIGELGEIVSSRPSMDEVKAGSFATDPRGLAVEIDLAGDSGEEDVKRVIDSLADVEFFEVRSPGPLEVTAPAAPVPVPEAPVAPEPRQAETDGVVQDMGRLESSYDPFSQVQALPQTVRVKTTALDRFINALGEMILVKSELREVAKRNPSPGLETGLDRLEALVKDFNEQVMTIRMMPLDSVVQRLPRVVRDLARDEGKKVKFEVKGQDIELDRAILEELNDPLIHLLRNSVNHGIEPPDERARLGKPPEGSIVLEAYRRRDLVLIDISDDGRGMDVFAIKESAIAKGLITSEQAGAMSDEDAYQLIFEAGFSTAKKVGMISGRGVGMDVVKSTVEDLGGFVTSTTRVGKGTTFTLHLPRTIAIVNVLLIRLGREIFAMPISKIVKTVEILPHQIRKTQGNNFFLDRQEMIPMKRLHRYLDVEDPGENGRREQPALIVEIHNRKTALIVDDLVGQEEAFIRPLGKPLERISGLSGVTMLGDGRVVFVLDTMGLL